MTDYSHRISNLSPDRRQLLARLLQTEGNKYNVFPLSFAQQRMWFLYQMEPASPFYNVALKLHFKGALMLHAVEQAVNEILRRHEVLRTTFSLLDGSPVQIISAHIGIDMPVLDLRKLSEAERESEVSRITEEESRRPFDLEKGPVLRTTLLRLGEQEHTLLLVTHHIVVDGWAIGILVREFAALYEAFADRRPSPLPPLPLQYVDFARQQQEWLEGEVQETQLAYWQQQLKGSRYVVNLPSDFQRPAVQTYRGAHQSVCFSAEMSGSIKSLCQSEGVTLFMFMLAAFNVLLYRYTGETDISIGSAISGRNRVETEGLIGFFANTLVLRHNLSGNPSFTELLKQVRRSCLEAYAHQDLPFEKLVEVLQPERDPSRPPLVQVVFSLQNDSLTQHTPTKALSLPGLSINLEVVNTRTVQFDLVLTIENTERAFGATLSYNADLFEAATISRMLRHYQMLLEEIVREPGQPLAHFSLLSPSQRHSLLAVGSGPTRPLSPALPLHQLFHRQALLSPHLPALCSGSGSLSYAQLDARSTQLALLLLSRFSSAPVDSTRVSTPTPMSAPAHAPAPSHAPAPGRAPAPRLALCLAPSFDLIVALLAALKAGLPCLLLTPSARPARLATLLREADADALLTLSPTHDRLLEALPATLPVWSLDLLAHELDAVSASALDALSENNLPPVPCSVHRTAYLHVMAGADGAPAAVEMSHAVVLNRVQWLQQEFGLEAGEAVLCHATATQPVEAVWQALWPLLYGGRVAIAEGASAAEVVRVIGEERVGVAHGGVREWRQWLEASRRAGGAASGSGLRGLRWALCSGEVMRQEEVQRVSEEAGCRVGQMYEVEAAGTAVAWRERRAGEVEGRNEGEEVWGRAVVNNVEVAVVEQGEMVVEGAWGEVWVRVTVGVEDGAGGEGERGEGAWEASGWVRSRDRGRWQNDGQLELRGHTREGGWVGLRRVESQWVERELSREDGVEECAVRVRRGQDGMRVVGYLVASGPTGAAGAWEQMRERVGARVDEEQLPQVVVEMSGIAVDERGEIEERKLWEVEVIEEERVREWEAEIAGVEGVREVAVVVAAGGGEGESELVHMRQMTGEGRDGRRGGQQEGGQQEGGQQEQGERERGEQGRDERGKQEGEGEGWSSEQGEKAGARGGSRRMAHSEGAEIRESGVATLSEALRRAVAEGGERSGVVYVSGGGAVEQSYGELAGEAERVMGGLRSAGVRAGEKVILQVGENEEFVVGFWGCVLGGFIPVPLAVPATYTQVNNATSTLHNVWQMLGQPVVITSREREAEVAGLGERWGTGKWRVLSVEELRAGAAGGEWHESKEEEMALMLFTSGSTGTPKGVVLTHRNIASMANGIAELNDYSSTDITLNWMPLHHVGGLVMFHLRDVFLACRQVQVETEDILEAPLRWLDLIESYRATVTWAPNFAFKLINEQADVIEQRHWDLSSVRLFVTGGEAVNAQTVATFLKLLAKEGLSQTAVRPGFGMSETSSSIIASEQCSPDTKCGVHEVEVISGNRVIRGSDSTGHHITFVDLGLPIRGLHVRIVDSNNQLLTEDMIGRIQVKGPQITPGYYNNPEANAEAFCDDGWFNTGDLGFLYEGRLTITGREKDVIIINGINYYSHEIEAVVEELDGVEVSYTAACGVRDGASNTDEVAIFFHAQDGRRDEVAKLVAEIRERVGQRVGVSPSYVVEVERAEIPKTAIGKIQRSLLKKKFEAGEFDDALTALDLALRNHLTLPDWCFLRSWFPRPLRHTSPLLPPPGSLLLFCDRSGLASRLSLRLSSLGFHCILVEPASDFARPSPSHFLLNPLDSRHYHRLCDTLAADSLRPSLVLHLWTYDLPPSPPASFDALRHAQRDGLFSLLWLVQALASVPTPPAAADAAGDEPAPVQLYFISRHAQASRPHTLLAPQHTTVPGLLKSLSAELPWLHVRHLDLETEAVEVSAERVLCEMRAVRGEAEVSYRGGERLTPRLERLQMSREPCVREGFEAGALYLVTGGLGGVGSYLARELMRRYGVRLLLVGRRELPPREQWEEEERRGGEAAKLIGRVRELEQSGGKWRYRAVDVCDGEALRRAVREVEAEYGARLRGVLHLAGEEQVERHWREMEEHWAVKQSEERMEEALRAKVYGTRAVYELVGERGGECEVVLFGSVNGVFGAATYGGYAAANSYLEGAAVYEREAGGVEESRHYSWTVWEGRGMSEGMGEYVREVVEGRGYEVMREEEGLWSLIGMQRREHRNVIIGLKPSNPFIKRLMKLSSPPSNKVVAYYTASENILPSDALNRLSHALPLNSQISFEFRRVEFMPHTDTGKIDKQRLHSLNSNALKADEYHAPQREIEKQMAGIWERILERKHIGLNDKFFEVGGNSLKSIRLLAAVNEKFSSNIAIVDLFKFSTIKALSIHVEQPANENGNHHISGQEF